MSFREYLPTWLGGARAAGNPIEFQEAYARFFGPGVGSQPDHATLLHENIGVADRATRALANRVSTLNPQVKVSKTDRAGTLVDEIIDDHVLKALLDRPHPDITRAQLLRLTTQWIVTVGEAYWYKVGNRLGVPTELHPVPPANIYPIVEQNVVTGYRITNGAGRQETIPADLIVRFYFPDPESPWTSEGYLGPSALTADSLKFAGEHLRAHYQHDATPKAVLKATAEADAIPAPGTPDRERLNTEWRKHYDNRAGTDRGLPGMLPPGWDLAVIAAASGADMVPLLEFWRDEQLMDFGVPRAVLGQVVSGDRSSAEVSQWVMDRYSVTPIANLIADGITLQLCPDFDAALFVEFEQFVSEDKRFNLEKQIADLNGKVRSINQVREDDGLDPVAWGEEPVGKLGEIPYTGEDFTFEPDDGAALGGDEPEPKAPTPTKEEAEDRVRAFARTQRAAHFTPEAEWQRQLAREKAYVPSFEREMKKILGIQERDTIKNLKAQMPRSRAPAAASIFSPDEWVDLFDKRVEPIRAKAFETILGETLGGLGVDEFTMTDEMRFLLKQQGALLVKHTNATTQSMIARQLELATAEGEGIDQIARRIKGVFSQRRKNHARTIARTEVLKASQEAQLSGFEIAGVESKQWNDSMDDAVRDDHKLDVPVVGIREPFVLGNGELAKAPGVGAGGAQLSAGNSINCRCFVTPVLEG